VEVRPGSGIEACWQKWKTRFQAAGKGSPYWIVPKSVSLESRGAAGVTDPMQVGLAVPPQKLGPDRVRLSPSPVEHTGGSCKAKLEEPLVFEVAGAGQKSPRGSGPENVVTVSSGVQVLDVEVHSSEVMLGRLDGTFGPVTYG
jgi:hypothetical protein